MAIPDSPDGAPASPREAGKSLYEGTLDVLMTGIAIIVPLVITLYVLQIVLDFITNALIPFIELLQWFGIIDWFRRTELVGALVQMGLYPYLIGFLTELITLALLLGIVVVVGSIGRHRYGERAIEMVDLAIAAIPGFGTVYKSFRRMGDVMLDNEAENFQEIKLVQCFDDDIYVIGFETSTSPETIADVTGHEEMVTLFIPLAPNPVTGGFLTHVPQSRVMDVDMTIEEGVRSILTSGVATGESASDPTPVTMGDLEKVTDIDRLQEAITADDGSVDEDETR